MKFDDFTKEQRTIIAEFIYSYETDILIKNDALKLIDIFIDKTIVDKNESDDLKEKIILNLPVIEKILEKLFASVDVEERKKIMGEFLGKKVSTLHKKQ